MSRWRWMAMPAVAALLSTGLLAACSSKKDGAAPTASSTQADTTPRPTDTSGSSTSDSGTSDEIKAIHAKLSAATFKGTYTLNATGAGAGSLTDGQVVLYKQGDKRIRFDVTGKQDGQDVQLVFIENGDKSLFCLKDPGGIAGVAAVPNGEGVCVNSAVNVASDDQNPAGSLSDIFSNLENADVTVLEKSNRTIAGMDADCYRSKDNQTAEISTVCFSSDGAVLSAQNEGDSASEIVATQIISSVSDTDFDPPYPVTDIPGLGSAG